MSEDAHGKGLAPLFSELIALHGKDASAIAQQLKAMGVEAGRQGRHSMGTFDRAGDENQFARHRTRSRSFSRA